MIGNKIDLFPITIATGKAFCNRTAEREELKKYIQNGRHTVIIASRRYGKTSLINQVLQEAKFPYTIMELTMATSLDDLERIIIKNVGTLLDILLPKTIKAKQHILNLFKWLNPEIVLTAGGQKITFRPDVQKTKSVETISDILKKLDEVASIVKKRVVVVMDEFQQITEIPNHTVEAAIRNAMQYSKMVSYIFSGSNRHMLMSMFNSKNRPFYNSCEIMRIERIESNEYESFIQHAAQQQWGKLLSQTTLEKIFELSELHSSYVNRICGYFWLTQEFPTPTKVEKFWLSLVESKRGEFTEDILRLSKNQKKILAYLAHSPTAHPSHNDVLMATGISEPSIRQAVRKLLRADYIYRDSEDMIRVLDPALKTFINLL